MLTLASGIHIHNVRIEDDEPVDYALALGTIYSAYAPNASLNLSVASVQTNEATPSTFYAVQVSRPAMLSALNNASPSDFDDVPQGSAVHLYQADADNAELPAEYKNDGAPIMLFE